MNRFALLAVAALVALPARSGFACLNDRDSDSLATQAAQLPATLRVITGRFERNPPLYYEMRIARERAALAGAPTKFGSYDDIGVALDKLGRDDEALQTMRAKRAITPAFNANDKANREIWYRTFANEGTFRAHRFLKAGAPVARLGEMKTARAQIKRAIEIKPDAHFGRERYQLMAMDWIIARKSKETEKTLGEWMAGRDGWKEVNGTNTLKNSNRERAVEGLSGLIVLGGAWESPDVFEALGAALETKDGVTLRYVALLRVQELLDEGKKSFWQFEGSSNILSDDYSFLDDYGIAIRHENQNKLTELNQQLRTDAIQWNAARQAWMTAKLKNGAHPDVDANFWSGYAETAPPSLDIEWYKKPSLREGIETATRIFTAVLCGIGALLCGTILFFVRRRRLRANLT